GVAVFSAVGSGGIVINKLPHRRWYSVVSERLSGCNRVGALFCAITVEPTSVIWVIGCEHAETCESLQYVSSSTPLDCGIFAVKNRYLRGIYTVFFGQCFGIYLVILPYVCNIFAELHERVWHMKRIAIPSTKGGARKTTSSIFLASALPARGSVQVWDADPQASASEWALLA